MKSEYKEQRSISHTPEGTDTEKVSLAEAELDAIAEADVVSVERIDLAR